MTTTVTAVMRDSEQAEAAVRALVAAGFARDTISVIAKDTPRHAQRVLEETEDRDRGVLSGALVGGAVSGILIGAMAVPALGIVAVGPVLAALMAGGAGAAAGSVIGAFVGHGLSLQVAQEYETAIAHGGIVVGVHTVHGAAARVRQILEEAGGDHLSDSVHLRAPRAHGEQAAGSE